jgi:hypothetical protein
MGTAVDGSIGSRVDENPVNQIVDSSGLKTFDSEKEWI